MSATVQDRLVSRYGSVLTVAMDERDDPMDHRDSNQEQMPGTTFRRLE